jgi:oligopeptidase A
MSVLTTLPTFSSIEISSFAARLDDVLTKNLAKINDILLAKTYTWENLMAPLDDLEDAFEQLWSPFAHLNAVVNSPELRQCYQECLPKLSAYDAAIGHNQALYNAINSLDKTLLDTTQQKIIDDALRDFHLSGVALAFEEKQRFESIQTRISDLSNQFENNVLDASQAFSLHITDAEKLQGLPEHALQTAKELAIENNQSGWLLNLEIPCYLAVVTYADDRALRETFYHAYVTRASDQGPYAGQFDNTDNINELLALRHEKAMLLGFANYAQLSLATKMAKSTDEVVAFMEDLSTRGYQQARQDMDHLKAFGSTQFGIMTLEPWDIAYLSEKLCQQDYAISQEDLRPYFPLDKVLTGLFTIINRLYKITFEKVEAVDTWHSDVVCYRLLDEQNTVRGHVYMDLFARQNKRGGAWMDSCRSRRRLPNGQIQHPIATLTCNFAKPAALKMATLSHEELLTLFHEMGHCLHHLLTKVDYLSASGINGVEWDAVELPSQIFENWCWEEEALQLLAHHVDTHEPLPKALYEKLLAAKNFQSAMAMMRQLEFSLFDFLVHRDFTLQNPTLVTDILNDVRRKTTVVPVTSYNRFQHSFTHIFAGGYAAGYYSYKWAEVLSSDAYARFEEEGVFNLQTGQDFLHNILEVGSSKKASEAFVAFRKRPAEVDALLRHNGIR